MTIEITAVGEEKVLAKAIESGGRKVSFCEALWSLDGRRWRRVRQDA